MADNEKIEQASQFGDEPSGKNRLWQTEIEAASKEVEKFLKDAKRINKRYLDKRDAMEEDQSRVNLFWSTIQVLLATIYARPPKADVQRLYKDFNDDASRVASEMLERMLNNGIEMDNSPFDASARHAIEDYLICGMGQVWGRYEAKTATEIIPEEIDPMTGQVLMPEQVYERLESEDAITEWVSYEDFLWSPARVWEEVRWVARRVFMTRDKLIERFGEEIGKKVPLSMQKAKQRTHTGEQKNDPWQKAEVWEIWCKTSKAVYWFAKGMDQLLDEKPDPLGLEGFFPCGQPLMANLTTQALLPRSDFIMAQDQFSELDEINTRIKYLTKAAKVVGAYDKTAGDSVGRILQQASENQLVPVDNWAMFAESGGIKGKMEWVPIEAITNAIEKLRMYRTDKVQQIYEVLGISDIMRGASKASETASAQQLKAQFGSTRLQLKQFFVAGFIQQALRIKAEIIMKHFQPQTIIERSNVQYTPDAQFAGEAVQLLKQTAMNRYRILIQADSMAAIDWASERDSRMEFLNGLGTFINAATPLAQSMPGASTFLLQILQWTMTAFKASSQIEGVLDQAIAGLKQMEQQKAQQPKPNPMEEPGFMLEVEKIKSTERIAQMEAMADKEIASLKATVELQKIELKADMDRVSQQYDQIANLVGTLSTTNQVLELEGIKEMVAANKMQTDEQLAQLMSTVSRKKKRIPIRDQNGDIVEVREEDDLGDATQGMAPNLPPGLPQNLPQLPPQMMS
jgi:hypothetical protein